MRKRDLVGKTIADIEWNLFTDGRGGWAHDPTIIFNDGSRLSFSTEETENHGYGVAFCYSPAAPE